MTSIIAAIRRRLYTGIESVPSDDLPVWILEHEPDTAELSAELVRCDTFSEACSKSFHDAIEKRESKAHDKWLDGEASLEEIIDSKSSEFQKVYGGWQTLAENNFGCRVDADVGHCRSLPEELRRRRPILLKHLQARFKSGDIPKQIAKSIDRLRELKIQALDLEAAEQPLRERAQIDPDGFLDALNEAASSTAQARTEAHTIVQELRHHHGYQGRL